MFFFQIKFLYTTIIFYIEAKKAKGKKSLTDEAPPAVNSHAADINMKQLNKAAETDEEFPAPSGEAEEPAKKDKSVLQAKLTKLAIQIGYAGR